MEFEIDILTSSQIRIQIKTIGNKSKRICDLINEIKADFTHIPISLMPTAAIHDSSNFIYCRFLEQDPPESYWRDFQRWRETLGLIVIAEVMWEEECNFGEVIQNSEIIKQFEDICEKNRLVLNTLLILVPTVRNVEIKDNINPLFHVALSNTNNQYDLEKPMYEFLDKILNKIDIEAANFADVKNEGLIITLADLNINEDFMTMKNRKICRKMKSVGDMLLLRGNYEEAILNFNTAIQEAETAQDFLWSSGALLGKASSLMLLKYGSHTMLPSKFDQIIYETLQECHSFIGKTKMTELEVEISLVIARYLAKFPQWKYELMDLIKYITKYDMKR